MGGVDKCDQYLSYYSVGRKTQNWWKPIFFRLFEMCITNSMCIYVEKHPEFSKRRNSHKLYCESLVHQLVEPYLEKKMKVRLSQEQVSKCKVANRRLMYLMMFVFWESTMLQKSTQEESAAAVHTISMHKGKDKIREQTPFVRNVASLCANLALRTSTPKASYE